MAMDKKQKAATESGALLAIAGAVAVALNVGSFAGGNVRVDATRNERYSLSKGSSNLLKNMKQPMKVEAYVTKGQPKLDSFVRNLRDMLEEYKNHSGGNFDYSITEPSTDDEKKAAKEAGLQEFAFAEGGESASSMALSQGYMGLVFKYGTEKDVIPQLPPGELTGFEFWLTSKIRELVAKVDDKKNKIGVITGHDELKLSEANLVPARPGQGEGPSVQQIITGRFPYYSVTEVDLKNGDVAIADDLDGVIITQPGKDYTDKELRRIDEFLMRGKSVAVIASAANVKSGDAQMQATLSTHGLEKLLAGYGVEMKKDVVIDFGFGARVPVRNDMGQIVGAARMPSVAQLQNDGRFTDNEQILDDAFPGFFRLNPVLFPFPSSLELHTEKQPDIAAAKDGFRFVARTSPRSLLAHEDNVSLRPGEEGKIKKKAQEEKQSFQQYGIAAAVEGTFVSAFKGQDKMGVEAPEKSVRPARLLVLSAAQMFANPLARASSAPNIPGMPPGMDMGGDKDMQRVAMGYAEIALQNPPNTLLAFKNTLDWLSGDSDLNASASKLQGDPPLRYESVNKMSMEDQSEDQIRKEQEEMAAKRKGTQRWVEFWLIAMLPAAFVGFGLWRRQQRLTSRARVNLA